MLSVLLAITLLTSGVLAQNPPGFTSQTGPPSFLGCYAAHTPESIVQPGLFGILACSSTCKNQGVRWFFWNPDTQGCACAPTTWGTPNFLLTGSNTVGCTSTNQVPPGCQSCPFNTWQYWDSETSFVTGYSTCYAQPNVNIALGSYKVIGVPNDCYSQCAKSTYAYVYANIAFNQWNCFCSDSYLVPGDTSFQGCQQGSVFVFAHSLQAQASGLFRRSRGLANPNKYCPGALQACKVADSSEGYECIDTRSELESCGGCVNGYFDNSTQHLGVNCDALSTHSQQYTCVAGLCQPL